MRSNDLTRRGALAGLTALCLAGPVRAQSTGQAQALIQQVVNETMGIVNSSASTNQALQQFQGILSRYGDIPTVARAVLGQPWNSASSAQQQAFVAAFLGYISRKYGREFREYRGSTMRITGAQDQGNAGIIVRSVVETPGIAPFTVDWQVSARSGSPKLVNMFIEGISMLSTERSEVRAILEGNRSNIDALIADLNKRG